MCVRFKTLTTNKLHCKWMVINVR